MTDRYAVIGHPIEHSKSPLIHRWFAEQTGQDLMYERLLGSLETVEEDFARFFAQGGLGLNVTLPFKIQARAWAHQISPRAARAGAANTLALQPDGRILADNTDGAGLVRDLIERHRLRLHGMRILLLGAGGASRGILAPLLDSQPQVLIIANRTPEKARELAALHQDLGPAHGCGLDDLAAESAFDLLINGTSSGVQGQVPALPDGLTHDASVVYDLFYADQPTPWMRWGQQQGARLVMDGLGMLVEQAAESFQLWRGVRPATDPVLARLRSA